MASDEVQVATMKRCFFCSTTMYNYAIKTNDVAGGAEFTVIRRQPGYRLLAGEQCLLIAGKRALPGGPGCDVCTQQWCCGLSVDSRTSHCNLPIIILTAEN